MKYSILILSILLIGLASAVPTMPIEARTGQPNTRFDYTFNFTSSADCTNVLLSYSDDITTDDNGNYMFQIPLSSLNNQIPYYLCEYRNDALRKTHEFSDLVFNSIRARNITTEQIYIKGDINFSDGSINNLSNLSVERINQDNYSIYPVSTGEQTIDDVFCLEMRSPDNGRQCKLIMQPGGVGQASIVRRSFAIVNDATCTGDENMTNMTCYASEGGFNWTIDFDSSLTGADLGVADDFEVIGDVRVRDTDEEVHSFNRELEIRDELYNNIVESPMNSTYDATSATLNITGTDSKNIFVNIQEVNYDLGIITDSIALTEGTNSTPIQNSVYYSNGGTPTLTSSTNFPDNVAQVAQMLLGDDFDYGSIVGSATNNEFIRGNYNRWYQQGASYDSGFSINVSSTEINISTGVLWILLDRLTTDSNHSSLGRVIEIHADGDFHQHNNNLSGFDSYSTGESIGTNKYFNLVCGIAFTHNSDGNMYCIVQNKPNTEHATVIDAENDNTYVSFFPANDFIKKIYIPVARIVVQNKPSGHEIQTLSTGDFFFDLRGTVSGSGSAPTAGVTALSQLTIDTNLNMNNVAGGYNQNITNADWIFADSINVSGTIIGPSSQFAQYEFTNNNFNGTGNFTTTGKGSLGNLDVDFINIDGNTIGNLLNNMLISVGGVDQIEISFDWIDFKDNDLKGLSNVLSDDGAWNITESGVFQGNGSQLTGIQGDNSSWNESYANSKYVTYIGASSNINLGSYDLTTTGNIKAESINVSDSGRIEAGIGAMTLIAGGLEILMLDGTGAGITAYDDLSMSAGSDIIIGSNRITDSGDTSIDFPSTGNFRATVFSSVEMMKASLFGNSFDILSLDLFTTGDIAPSRGSSATPSHSFSVDRNTGMWSPSADVLALGAGGSEGLRIDATDSYFSTDGNNFGDAANGTYLLPTNPTIGDTAYTNVASAGTSNIVSQSANVKNFMIDTNGVVNERVFVHGVNGGVYYWVVTNDTFSTTFSPMTFDMGSGNVTWGTNNTFNENVYLSATSKLYFNNSYLAYVGGVNESIGVYNSSGGFGVMEARSFITHTFSFDGTDEEAYDIYMNAQDNFVNSDGSKNYSAWGVCRHADLIKDKSRPEIVFAEEEVCGMKSVPKQTTNRVCETTTIQDCKTIGQIIEERNLNISEADMSRINLSEEYCEEVEEDICEDVISQQSAIDHVCEIETVPKVDFPHKILNEGINLDCVMDITQKALRWKTGSYVRENESTVFNDTIVAEHIVTDTPQFFSNFSVRKDGYQTIISAHKDGLLRGEDGKIKQQYIPQECKSIYGSYDVACLSEYYVELLLDNSHYSYELWQREQSRNACWDLATPQEIINCQRLVG